MTAEYEELSKKKLQELCKERDLKVSGNVAELRERLNDHDALEKSKEKTPKQEPIKKKKKSEETEEDTSPKKRKRVHFTKWLNI